MITATMRLAIVTWVLGAVGASQQRERDREGAERDRPPITIRARWGGAVAARTLTLRLAWRPLSTRGATEAWAVLETTVATPVSRVRRR
jgi:hypothetical protein